MLLSEFIREASAGLEALYPAPEARSLALMLCEKRLGTKSYTHIVEPSTQVPDDQLPVLRGLLARMIAGEPIQYVLGEADFYGHTFKVAPGVLIPRPETEMLVDWAVKAAAPGARVLDLCTGSGCIAISVALAVPGARVTGVDISPEALAIASSQPCAEGVSVEWKKADILDMHSELGTEAYDLLLSNPPYIKESEKAQMRPNVLEHEPELALFVPDSNPLVFYKALAQWVARLLRPGGKGIVEINETLGEQTADVFRQAGLQKVEVLPDFFAKNRFVIFER